LAVQALQGGAQVVGNAHRIGGFDDIQEGTVDIEKERAGCVALAQPVIEQGPGRGITASSNGRVGQT